MNYQLSKAFPEAEFRDVNCEIHGAYSAEVRRWTDGERVFPCPTCEQWREEDEKIAAREAWIAASIRREKEAACIPDGFHSAEFSNYEPANDSQHIALAAVRKYAKEVAGGSSANIVLMGDVGLGKSHLLAAATLSVIDAGLTARFARFSVVLETAKASWRNPDGKTEQEILLEFKIPDFLVLDDIGNGQTGTESDRRIIESIVDSRWSNSRPTAVTTNATSIAALESFVGPRVVSRLLDRSIGSGIVVLNGSDYRRSKTELNRQRDALYVPTNIPPHKRDKERLKEQAALKKRVEELWAERLKALGEQPTALGGTHAD